MYKSVFLFAGILFYAFRPISFLYTDSHQTEPDTLPKARIVFYNVENLFHPSDDSLKEDDDFTPAGSYHWTYNRYMQKLRKIAQVMVSLSAEGIPAVIGLCEIENRKVLEDLIKKTVLKSMGYKIIHQESDDARGIDVALLYDPKIFMPESYELIHIFREDGQLLFTRGILRVSGYIHGQYPCHFFVNHWPSRRGGQKASESRRILTARYLREDVERILETEIDPNIIIMGDFNDEPSDISLKHILRAEDQTATVPGAEGLYNLMFIAYRSGMGTHYRKHHFIESSVLDQFIVSEGILLGLNGLKSIDNAGRIYRGDYLLNEKNGMPLRTYQGLKYIGGFSDHFPVYLDIYYNYAE